MNKYMLTTTLALSLLACPMVGAMMSAAGISPKKRLEAGLIEVQVLGDQSEDAGYFTADEDGYVTADEGEDDVVKTKRSWVKPTVITGGVIAGLGAASWYGYQNADKVRGLVQSGLSYMPTSKPQWVDGAVARCKGGWSTATKAVGSYIPTEKPQWVGGAVAKCKGGWSTATKAVGSYIPTEKPQWIDGAVAKCQAGCSYVADKCVSHWGNAKTIAAKIAKPCKENGTLIYATVAQVAQENPVYTAAGLGATGVAAPMAYRAHLLKGQRTQLKKDLAQKDQELAQRDCAGRLLMVVKAVAENADRKPEVYEQQLRDMAAQLNSAELTASIEGLIGVLPNGTQDEIQAGVDNVVANLWPLLVLPDPADQVEDGGAAADAK